MKSLIVGMGIGNLYKDVLAKLGYEVVTVDTNPLASANFTDLEPAMMSGPFDTVHICTPNYTHESIARLVAPLASIVFVEKPGVESAAIWQQLTVDYPDTKFIMVKNNMWRSNITELKALADKARHVKLNWINNDRVPSPGTWFTTKKLAFGGVSRDLMPHLLSLFVALNPNWKYEIITGFAKHQRYKLAELTNTEYGSVKADGVYDVDDICHYSFGDKWTLTADWRSLNKDQRNIEFFMPDGSVETFELGLCPEEAYFNMIQDTVANLNNKDFWNNQLDQDLWIHKHIDSLCK